MIITRTPFRMSFLEEGLTFQNFIINMEGVLFQLLLINIAILVHATFRVFLTIQISLHILR